MVGWRVNQFVDGFNLVGDHIGDPFRSVLSEIDGLVFIVFVQFTMAI